MLKVQSQRNTFGGPGNQNLIPVLLASILPYINPIKIIAALTLLHAVYRLKRSSVVHHSLFAILIVGCVTEAIFSILWFFGIKSALVTTISVIIYDILWLLLLSQVFLKIKYIRWAVGFFTVFAIINLLCFEGMTSFDFATFITGAFLFLVVFIYKSFQRLQQEDLPFFQSNDYILICSPLLFYLGMSLVFGFRSHSITTVVLFWNINLYDFVIYFVNIFYYSLINIYIQREKKMNYAT